METVLTFALLLAGFGLTQLSYAAVKSGWPEVYVALSETFALGVIARWWRILAFRGVPVFLVVLLISATAGRVGANAAIAAAGCVILHLVFSNVGALIRSFLPGTKEFTVNYAPYHFTVVLVVVISAVLANLATPALQVLVPSPSEMVSNLWIAGLVAVTGALFVRLGSAQLPPPFGGQYFLERATRDVGVDLQDDLFIAAKERGADPVLLLAIMVAEVLQRPSWVRAAERLVGRFRPTGSYGVMQVRSSRPLTDQESIEIASTQLSGQWGMSIQNGVMQPVAGQIWSAAAAHQGDAVHAQNVLQIYTHLFYQAQFTPSPWCSTHIFQVRRNISSLGIRGVTSESRIEL